MSRVKDSVQDGGVTYQNVERDFVGPRLHAGLHRMADHGKCTDHNPQQCQKEGITWIC